jgi:hypothetical protein
MRGAGCEEYSYWTRGFLRGRTQTVKNVLDESILLRHVDDGRTIEVLPGESKGVDGLLDMSFRSVSSFSRCGAEKKREMLKWNEQEKAYTPSAGAATSGGPNGEPEKVASPIANAMPAMPAEPKYAQVYTVWLSRIAGTAAIIGFKDGTQALAPDGSKLKAMSVPEKAWFPHIGNGGVWISLFGGPTDWVDSSSPPLIVVTQK